MISRCIEMWNTSKKEVRIYFDIDTGLLIPTEKDTAFDRKLSSLLLRHTNICLVDCKGYITKELDVERLQRIKQYKRGH